MFDWPQASGRVKVLHTPWHAMRIEASTARSCASAASSSSLKSSSFVFETSARFPLRRIEDPIYEYACHEGNHGMVGILAGWRRYEAMGMNGDGTFKEDGN